MKLPQFIEEWQKEKPDLSDTCPCGGRGPRHIYHMQEGRWVVIGTSPCPKCGRRDSNG